ncbi:hypothetical protein TNCT_690151 [Trichonephila clavata]|uniref:Uncharacterized protein n=1 Tax=Trichonephila clavata TaxID=2740835 RepID=A0A8X6G4X6_TRICU|nr:hypothetical protein TNCT_690151 [Trichonephila clavata]
MRLIEDFNDVPSLSYLAGSQIVIRVFNHPRVQRLMSEYLEILNRDCVEGAWEALKKGVKGTIRTIAGIDSFLDDDLDALIIQIGFHILSMKVFFNYSPDFPNSDLNFPVNYWTPYGTADTKRFDEMLVRDVGKSVAFRYNLACHDCFKPIVQELYRDLTPQQQTNFLDIKEEKELLSYWTHSMSYGLDYFVVASLPIDVNIGPNLAHKLAFRATLKDGSKSGIEYFLSFLPSEDIEDIAGSFLYLLDQLDQRSDKRVTLQGCLSVRPPEHYSDSTYFLLSRLSENQRNMILPEHYIAVLRNFLRYPFFGLFSKYIKIWRGNFSQRNFYNLLEGIVKARASKAYTFEYDLFADLWNVCPQVYREEIIYEAKTRYQGWSDYTAKLILEKIENAQD